MAPPVAIVTGASRGIGRAIASRLARSGYSVAFVGRDEEALKESIRLSVNGVEVSRTAGAVADDDEQESVQLEPLAKRKRMEAVTDVTDQRFIPVVADLKGHEEARETVKKVVESLGPPSVVVCNAGILQSASMVDGDPSKWELELDVNVKGTMGLVRHALPHILKSSEKVKAVVVIGSTGSRWSWPYGAGYCASKHALRGFVGSLFEEVRDKGIKVCIVNPGFTDTDMTSSNPGMIHEKKMRPDDVAHAVECVLQFPESACPTEMLLRPQYSCVDGTFPYTVV